MGCTCFRCTSFCRCLLGGALVSSAPSNYFAPLPLLVHHFLCWCTTSLAGAPLPLLVHHLLCWCSSCSVGALETSAPPKCATVRVRRPIGFRSPSDQIPSAVRLDSVRRRWKSVGKNVARTLCSTAILSANSPSLTSAFFVVFIIRTLTICVDL